MTQHRGRFGCAPLALYFLVYSVVAVASPYQLLKDPEKPRNEGAAALSYLLPGFSQWKEGRHDWAGLYSGLGVAGISYAVGGLVGDKNGPTFRGSSRHFLSGAMIYSIAGGLSGHHAFRTVVRSQQRLGKYPFLTHEESPLKIATSAFRLDYLLRPTTLIPLAASAALFFAVLPNSSKSVALNHVSLGDAAFTGIISYGAGTGEEAMFRGVLMPLLNQKWENPFLANLATAGIFAALHIDPDDFFVPWPQFVAGLYLGWLAQYREWTISEAIFVHTWYDILVLTAAYATSPRDNLKVRFPPIVIPF